MALVKDINTGTQFALKKVPCETMEATRTAQREVTLLVNRARHFITLARSFSYFLFNFG